MEKDAGWIQIKKGKAQQQQGPSQPRQGSIPFFPKFYVVFTGRQPGIYTSWPDCQQQVYQFPGACYQSYSSLEIAKQAFLQFSKKPTEVKDFYNPNLPYDVYQYLNGAWKAHINDQKGLFRQNMGKLADKIAETTAKTEKKEQELEIIKQSCFKIIKQMDWDNETSYEKISAFLTLADLISERYFDSTFEKIKRICLFEKTKKILPPEIFFIIHQKIEDHKTKIKNLLKQHKDNLNVHHSVVKCSFILEESQDEALEAIEWGIANQVIFQEGAYQQFWEFPSMIKTILAYTAEATKMIKYLTFWVVSSIGWRERDKFYQPYQLWILRKTEEIEFSDITETRIQGGYAYENVQPEPYFIESLVRLSQQAKGIDPSSFMITDGRRIFITGFPCTYEITPQQEQEAQMLLQRIIKRQGLDIPLDLAYEADEYEAGQQYQDSQGSSFPDFDDEILNHNLENAMEP